MTAEEFYAGYSERSKIPVEDLVAMGFRAFRCDCGEDGCHGWAMLRSAHVEEGRRDGVDGQLLAGVAAGDQGWAPSGH